MNTGHKFIQIILVLVLIVGVSGCINAPISDLGTNDDITEDNNTIENESVGIADPAAVYCGKLGYNWRINETEKGQQGLCILPNGTECDEWRFFAGKCYQEYTYCEQHNGTILTKKDGNCSFEPECAFCILSTGEECLEWEYFNGECPKNKTDYLACQTDLDCEKFVTNKSLMCYQNTCQELYFNENWKICDSDSDCVETTPIGCSCTGGGSQIGINKKYLEIWQSMLMNSTGTVCPAVITCVNGVAKCINNTCEFIAT